MGTKEIPAEVQNPEAVTPKGADSTTFGFINKFVLQLKKKVAVTVIN